MNLHSACNNPILAMEGDPYSRPPAGFNFVPEPS